MSVMNNPGSPSDPREPKPSARKVDLHTHSTASDGLYPPAELVRLAHEAGLDLIGLVDHDTTGGLAEAQAAGAQLGVTIIPGVEINTDLRGGGEAHILGYYISQDDPSLMNSLGKLRDAREKRGERMVGRLRDAGYDVSWERVRALAGGAVGRPHVARALIEAGYARDVSDAFDRYLSPSGPGFVPRYKLAPEDAIRIIRAARGIPTLAHPRYVRNLEETVLSELVAAGLQGLECYYGQYDEGAVARLVALADRYDLITTGGSDYHGPNMHPTPLGGRYVPPQVATRLWEARQQTLTRPNEPFTLELPTL
jgi:predicted metal-dependent phosphoesterase TrpH